jgi:hypothetical protein
MEDGLSGTGMQFTITEQVITTFLSGFGTVAVLVAVGAVLSLVLRGMAQKFPFTRMALVLTLAPYSFAKFLDRGGIDSLYLYAIIIILLGITIDGICHLQLREHRQTAPKTKEKKDAGAEPSPDGIVWEKAE